MSVMMDGTCITTGHSISSFYTDTELHRLVTGEQRCKQFVKAVTLQCVMGFQLKTSRS